MLPESNKTAIAVLEADLEVTPLGTRSRLGAELAGVPVLRRTAERLRGCRRIKHLFAVCPSAQYDRCVRLLEGTGVHVRTADAPPPAWRNLVAAARKWSLDGWRGGIGGTTVFDDYCDPRVIAGLLEQSPADAVWSVPPGAVLFDPQMADEMVDRLWSDENDARLMFAPAPPGVAGFLMKADLVHELAEKNISPGWLFSYKPDAPRKDLVFESCCFSTAVEVRYAAGRLIADTDRACRTLADYLKTERPTDARSVCAWLLDREPSFVEPLPREVELELTTDDPYPESLLRPRGKQVPPRGPVAIDLIRHVVETIAQNDDALLVLAGFGDSLCHPRFRDVLRAIREHAEPSARPLYGLAVRTTGVALDDAAIDALIEHRVDILEVTLDAWTPELYARLHSPNAPDRASLSRVLENLERLEARRQQCSTVYPIVVPSFTKIRENVHEMDAFYDGWLRRLGSVAIHGGCHYARQFEDRTVIDMTPPTRFGCRRIRSRCTILADGTVTMCDQDFQGRHAVGRLPHEPRSSVRGGPQVKHDSLVGSPSLSDIWHDSTFRAIRAAHLSKQFGVTPLCAACDEWHRP